RFNAMNRSHILRPNLESSLSRGARNLLVRTILVIFQIMIDHLHFEVFLLATSGAHITTSTFVHHHEVNLDRIHVFTLHSAASAPVRVRHRLGMIHLRHIVQQGSIRCSRHFLWFQWWASAIVGSRVHALQNGWYLIWCDLKVHF